MNRLACRFINDLSKIVLVVLCMTSVTAHAAITTSGAFTTPMYPVLAPDPWNINSISIGGTIAAPGALHIDDGSRIVIIPLGSSNSSILGAAVTHRGEATVTGPDSQWQAGSILSVGERGGGIVNVLAGAFVSDTDGFIAKFTGDGDNRVTVSDPNSTWNNSRLFLGGDAGEVGDIGANSEVAELYIQNGGAVNVLKTLKVWNNVSSINMSDSSSTLEVGAFDNAAGGSLNFSGGTFIVDGTSNVADGIFNPGSASFTLDGEDNPTLVLVEADESGVTGTLIVGNSDDGTFELTSGSTFSNTTTRLGNSTGSLGVALVTGTGTTWNNSGLFFVGDGGSGVLDITDNATVNSGGARVGETGFGSANINTNATWDNSSEILIVANAAGGNMTIASGGTVKNASGRVGDNSGVTGTVNVNGGTWTNTGNLLIGNEGIGSLSINNSGTVTSSSADIGSKAVSQGTVNANSGTWTNSGSLKVGNAGDGTLNVNGATVSNTTGTIGDDAGTTGIVSVGGGAWNNSGNLLVGNLGEGSLTVNGGAVTVDGTTTVNSISSVSLSSGSLTTTNFTNTAGGNLSHTGGTLTIDGGTYTAPDEQYRIDGVDTPELVLDGATFDLGNNELQIGFNRSGNLIIDGGTSLTSGPATVGAFFGSTGDVTVNNGVWTIAGGLGAGAFGTGNVTINTDGLISSESGGIVGINTMLSTVNVQGGIWNNSTSLSIGGSTGPGLLDISSGGTVTADIATTININGELTLSSGSLTTSSLTNTASGTLNHTGGTINIDGGAFAPSSGGYTLNGPGNPTVNLDSATLGLGSNFMIVGGSAAEDSSQGTLNINNGSIVTNNGSEIGRSAGSTGTVSVTSNSTWSSNSLRVGRNGTGTLNINSGGEVNNTSSVIIGELAGSNGTVNVNGGTWNTTLLAVGSVGTGLLEITGGGVVINTGTTTINLGSTLDLSDGSLTTTTLSNTVGAFNFTGGTLQVDTYLGDLLQQGGTLAAGASPGLTTISGDYTLNAGAILEVELAEATVPGTDYDRYDIGGFASLQGTLDVSLLDGFIPELGDSFGFLTAPSGFDAMFDNLVLPALSTGLQWQLCPGGATLFLNVVADTTPGDFDVDGDVDGSDFLVWQRNPSVGLLTDWQTNYGTGSPPLASSRAVPEPATWTVTLLALMATLTSRQFATGHLRGYLG